MGYPTVRLISDGQAIDEVYTNKPIADLVERTDYLKTLLDSLTGDFSSLTIFNAPCSDSCLDSNVVFFDPATSKWDRGLAALLLPGTPVEERLAPSGYIQGVIRDITGSIGAKIGTVILGGLIEDLNIVNFVAENTVTVGAPMYLSGTDGHDGQLTYTPPSVEIFCGKFVSSSEFLFTIDIRNIGERHKHIWIPLDMSLFEETEAGKWIYPYSAIVAEQGDMYWPPLSYSSAILSVNGIIYFQDPGQTYFYLSADGLHYENADYPIDATDPDILSMVLYYQVPFGQDADGDTGTSGVTSLYASTPNLHLYRLNTATAASTGNLEIKCIPITTVVSTTTLGTEVVKSLTIDASTGELKVYKGAVVEQLYSGTGNVKLTYYTDDATGDPEHTGFLAIHIINEIAYSTPETASGSLVFKDIAVDAITGEITVDRGLVVESIQPVTNSRLQIFTHGTTDVATQGTLDIKVRDIYRLQFVYKDVTAALTAEKIFDASGSYDNQKLVGTGSIVGMFARIDRAVTISTLTLAPFLSLAGTGPENTLPLLDIVLSSAGEPEFDQKSVNIGVYTYTEESELGVKMTTGATFAANVGAPPDYATVEVVFFVVKD